ncbi:MAG TPA: hypothetical protein PK899_13500, partial [Spirochaetota bacterium]|nr:hypothetical protein [Spirochaetota bacterium]
MRYNEFETVNLDLGYVAGGIEVKSQAIFNVKYIATVNLNNDIDRQGYFWTVYQTKEQTYLVYIENFIDAFNYANSLMVFRNLEELLASVPQELAAEL